MPLYELRDGNLSPIPRLRPGPSLYEHEIETLVWGDLGVRRGPAVLSYPQGESRGWWYTGCRRPRRVRPDWHIFNLGRPSKALSSSELEIQKLLRRNGSEH